MALLTELSQRRAPVHHCLKYGCGVEGTTHSIRFANPDAVMTFVKCRGAEQDQVAAALGRDSSIMRPSKRWMMRSACFSKRGSCVTMQIVAPSR